MTRRLLLTYVTFALLILVALEVPLGWMQERNEQQHALEQLEHDAEVLAAFVDSALSDDQGQVGVLAAETAQRLGGHVDVLDGDGRTISSTHPGPDVPDAADVAAVLHGQGRVKARISADGSLMSVIVSVHPGVAAQGAIRVSVPTESLRGRIHRFWLLLAGAGVAVLIVAALIAVALARWISRPVRALEVATREMSFEPAEKGPPELRRLAATFAATGRRMRALVDTQRAFVGHASHQLKTPLAALRLRLENLSDDAAAYQARDLRAALAETDRLTRLVDTLLTMARYEQVSLRAEPVSLPAAVEDRLQHWSPVAAASQVRLLASGPDAVSALALPGALEQILDNLLANAVRAAPPDTVVTVGWTSAAELHVIDQGPGLTEEQRARAMDPFWRAPDAPKGGTGLGLALVRQLAEAGGGSAALLAAPGSGVDACVRLRGTASR